MLGIMRARRVRGIDWRVVVASTMLALAGCSRSHDIESGGFDPDASVGDSDEGGGGGSSGRSGNGGRGGTGGVFTESGGTGGRGGAQGAAGRAGAAGSSTTNCSNCPDPGFLAGFIQAASCCTSSNTCGLSVPALGVTDCLPLEAPGEANASCPPVAIAGLIQLNGCCSPDGNCGALDTFLGLGCAQVAAQGQAMRCTPD